MSKYEQINLPGGIDTIIQIAENLREINTDGYLDTSHGGGFLVRIKPWNTVAHLSGATTCSPFTGTVLGVAYDPDYASKDQKKDTYLPVFNGEAKTSLPYAFYAEHNNNDRPVESVVDYGLGKEIEFKDMKRGDVLGINWKPKGGHCVFCWDVHLNAKGEVDCFQMLGSHGGAPGAPYYGISIYGCETLQVTGGLAHGGRGTGSLEKASKYNGKIFFDSDEWVENGVWFAPPGIPAKGPGSIDLSTFRVTPRKFSYSDGPSNWVRVKDMKVGRLNYEGASPKPYCMKDGSAPARDPQPPGHLDAPVTTIKGNDIKKDPEAPKKVQPKPATQEKTKPLNWQHAAEQAMQQFYRAKWIDADPGSSDDINDAKTQAAAKKFQALFKPLKVDGIIGQHTRDEINKQLPACVGHVVSQMLLGKLYRGGKLKTDPGPPDGVNNSQTSAAVKEFQKLSGLEQTGVPDADTLEKLSKAVDEHAPSSSKHGLEPTLLVLYWLGNTAPPGGSATLRLHSIDLKKGLELQIFLKDTISGKEIESKVKMVASGDQSEVSVPIPPEFGEGAIVLARVKGALDDGKSLELPAPALLFVRTAVKQTQTGDLQKFFTFDGMTGEGKRERQYQYVAYKVPAKPQAWLMKGRLIMDVDGAPNAYHPDDHKVNTRYWEFDFENYDGALDWMANGGHPGNWFGVVTDTGEVTGTRIIQGANDPFPGFCVASTSLADKNKKRNDPTRYVDARKVPYLAWPPQIWAEKGTGFTRVAPGPTGTLGDIITAYYPKTNKVAHLVYADNGGWTDQHFGEGSPALAKLLDAWGGIAEPAILYIVYPHSGAGQGTVPTADEIREKGEKLFKEWGGVDEVNRVLPLMESGGVGSPHATGTPAATEKPAAAGDTEKPLGDPKCDRCTGLQKLLGAGVEQKIKSGGSDKSSIKLLQYHLLQFGYPMGKSGPGGDGVDGDFGSTTEKELGAFLKEIGASGNSNSLSADAARLVLERHKAGFKTAGTPKAKPQPEAGEMHWGIDYAVGDDNKNPDWKKAKDEAKLSFVAIKAAQGPWSYPKFYKTDFGAAGDAGLTRGAYLFLDYFQKKDQKRLETPEDQVKLFIDTAGDFAKTDFPPTIDVEDSVGKSGMGVKGYIEWTRRAWKALFKRYGAAPMIYTATHLWEDSDELNGARADDLIDSPLWLAKPYLFNKHEPASLDPGLFAGGKNAPARYREGQKIGGQSHWPAEVPKSWGGTADPDNWWIHQYHGDAWKFPGFNQVDVNRFNSMVKGATGERVKWVQRRLGIDQSGTYDDAAIDKVKELQSGNGIDPADGVIGPRTFAVLCWMNPPKP